MKEKIDPLKEEDLLLRQEFEQLPEEKKLLEKARLEARAWLENTPVLRKKAELVEKEQEQRDLQIAADLAEVIKAEGGRAFIVGGYVRDEVLRKFGYNVEPKDIDIEVYGIQKERLMEILKSFGKLDLAGVNFEVIKLTVGIGSTFDISLPRKDSKVGRGHKGIKTEFDPNLSMVEASKRRDFTINSMFLDPLTGEIVDKHGGFEDMQNKILRATDDDAFVEDPLRVIRGAQFAGRFDFKIDPHTTELCRSIDLAKSEKVVPERMGIEWEKLLVKSPKPSVGLEAMRELGVIDKLHPELQALIGVPQDPGWHPEGDVWMHTKLVIDAAARIIRKNNVPDEEAAIIMFAALCHDLGKPETTATNKDGRITSKGHSEKGLDSAKTFLASLKISNDRLQKILPLIQEHLFPHMNPNPSATAVSRLAKRLHPATIQELAMVSEADVGGRGQILESYPEGEALVEAARGLNILDNKPKEILMGRHLLETGFKPGKNLGEILRKVFEAQLEGLVMNLDECRALAIQFGKAGEITESIKSELKAYGESHGLRGLEGRAMRGLDPAGMLAVKITREKLEKIAQEVKVPIGEVEKFTGRLHVGGIWENADKLSKAHDKDVLMWLLMAYATDEGKRSEGEMESMDFVKDLLRINRILDKAVENPVETLQEAKALLINRSKEDFYMDGDVPVSDVDNGFMAMAMNGYKSGIGRDNEGLLFVGANELDFSVLENIGLKATQREDRGRKATFFVDDNGNEIVKKLYQGFAIVLSKDVEVAKALARTGK